MSTIDDELRELLEEVGRSIEVPTDGPSRIIDAALAERPSEPALPKVTALVPRERRTRTLVASAAMVALAAAIALPLLAGSAPATRSALSGHAAAGIASPQSPGLANSSLNYAFAAQGTRLQWGAAYRQSGAPSQSTKVARIDQTKVISVGTVGIQLPVDRLQPTVIALSSLAQREGGYVASSQVNVAGARGSASTANVVLRVPEAHYSGLVAAVSARYHVTSLNTSSTDVTSQFVDLHARIAALEISRQQYLAIMSRANSISDVLAIQAQVNNIQVQIEQLQGQLNVLTNQAAFGTLTVEMNYTGAPGHARTGAGVSKAWNDGIQGVIVGFEWIVRLAGPTLFVLVCLAALFFAGRSLWRVTRRRML